MLLFHHSFLQYSRTEAKMVYALKVFKKTSPNSKVTVYLGKRDFVDNITKIEAVGMSSFWVFPIKSDTFSKNFSFYF